MAASYRLGSPRWGVWADHQEALLELARAPGVDERALTEAVIDACCECGLFGHGSPLEQPTFRWMMRVAPDRVYDALEGLRWPGARFLRQALWTHAEPGARRWMAELFRTDPSRAGATYLDMRVGYLRACWDAEEWSPRAHMLCDAPLERLPWTFIDPGLPPGTSAAQVRVACTYASGPKDDLLRAVARNLRGYRSGDPAADADLVWWDAKGPGLELLRALLEAAGSAGERPPLVGAAEAAGRLDARRAAVLRAEHLHEAWMDGEVPWVADGVVDAGTVDIPDGRAAADDPWWAFEGLDCVAQVPPGRHRVRVTMAAHPLRGRACAVAELVVEGTDPPERWERLGAGRDPQEFGYRVEVGCGIGAAAALSSPPEGFDESPDIIGMPGDTLRIVDAGELGSFVAFQNGGEQRQLCRTWAGRSRDGAIARIVSDLGLLHIDPETHPKDPWRPGPPPPRPSHEPWVSPGGVTFGVPYREAGGAPDATVSVLQELDPARSWVATRSIWYRWDDTRIGECLAVEQFRRRFIRAG